MQNKNFATTENFYGVRAAWLYKIEFQLRPPQKESSNNVYQASLSRASTPTPEQALLSRASIPTPIRAH